MVRTIETCRFLQCNPEKGLTPHTFKVDRYQLQVGLLVVTPLTGIPVPNYKAIYRDFAGVKTVFMTIRDPYQWSYATPINGVING